MPGLNRVMLIGNLGKDPETRYTPKGSRVCTFSLAVNRNWKNQEGERQEATEWFNVEAWGRLADNCQKFLQKGMLIYLEGRFQTDRYEQDGETHYRTKLVASRMMMLNRKEGAEAEAYPEEEEEM